MVRRPASTTCLTGSILFLWLALLFCSIVQAKGAASEETGGEQYYVPVVKQVVYRRSSSVRTAEAASYEPFEVCEGCRCCAVSNASECVDTSCCYAIDCDIPGKPFGFCAFTPQTCGCGANNCTQQPT